jgi:hypothetical protein
MPRRPVPRPAVEASALQELDMTPIFNSIQGAGKVDETQLLPIVAQLTSRADDFPRELQHNTGEARGLFAGAALRDERGMIKSPNHSARSGKPVRLLIVHTAEGARTVASLGGYFANAANEVSSHAGIDDQRIETYVAYDRAAWTCRGANDISDNVELCGFARWTRSEWLNDHPNMLSLAAQWLRERAAARGIPLRKLTPQQVAQGQSGVIAHVDWTIGMKDGTHTDCGGGFPWDVVMAAATSPPTPAPGAPMEVAFNQGSLPAGDDMVTTIGCPVGPGFLFAEGWLTLAVGWNDAADVNVFFIADPNPDGTPHYLPGFELGVLRKDIPVPIRIPPGTHAISMSYTSDTPIGWSTELLR